MQTSYIIQSIYQDFAKKYRPVATFVNSGELWDFCIAALSDPVNMGNIAFANDMGVPPMASLLMLYQRQQNPPAGFQFPEKERQHMGALLAFVFKYVLGYQKQSERCTVQRLGVKKATRYLDGPVHVFTA